jgi:alpha-tubulin suppressor-like RCC1 family protein
MPVRALQRHTITSIAAGGLHSGCVDKDSNPWLWGHGGHWQLGLGHNTHECLPQQVSCMPVAGCLCVVARAAW